MAEHSKILIVDDERRIARFLQIELEHEGYVAETEGNGRKALERILSGDYELVLLDVMLPDMAGMTICRKVREKSDVPIIMLTAKDEIEDKVSGLDIGADDYVTKPFAIEEVMARIRAVLRSHEKEEAPEGEKLIVRNLTMYPSRFEVTYKDDQLQLTKKEFLLLEYLMRNKRNVLTREQILQEVWGYDYIGDTNVVDVYIRYLRAKIDDKYNDKFIYTVRGVGYVIKE